MKFEPRELKYVILKTERAVIFSPSLAHSDIVGPSVSVQSAGHCRLVWSNEEKKIKVSAYGKSVTLGVSSQEGDSEVLEATVNKLDPWGG